MQSRNQVIKLELQVKSSHLPFKTQTKSSLLVQVTRFESSRVFEKSDSSHYDSAHH